MRLRTSMVTKHAIILRTKNVECKLLFGVYLGSND
jgi:hypothetical protein